MKKVRGIELFFDGLRVVIGTVPGDFTEPGIVEVFEWNEDGESWNILGGKPLFGTKVFGYSASISGDGQIVVVVDREQCTIGGVNIYRWTSDKEQACWMLLG